MSFDYAPLVEDASTLLEEFGKFITFDQPATTPPDAEKPWEPGAAGVGGSFGAWGVELVDQRTARVGESSSTKSTDRRFLVSVPADGQVPTTADRLRFTGEDAKAARAIDDVQPVQPGSTTLLYIVRCRA